MIPLGSRDVPDPTKALPIVTIGLILANFLVFFYELSVPQAQTESFFNAWALVPCEYTSQCAVFPGAPTPFWLTLVTSMFLHGGWDHILGNMLFLGVFGIHVERSMGPLRYLVFYFVSRPRRERPRDRHLDGLERSGARRERRDRRGPCRISVALPKKPHRRAATARFVRVASTRAGLGVHRRLVPLSTRLERRDLR